MTAITAGRSRRSPKRKTTTVADKDRFYVLNSRAQVWCGLSKGKPVFSDNWNEAKPLYNDEQLFNLRMTADYDDRSYEKVKSL
jgi:hypothetical protein